ncbi:MAG: hypothetical protein HUU38_03525 [Anaerolineales bacterium]|nr:hypothetical protein [Anaerolineales bacterium]
MKLLYSIGLFILFIATLFSQAGLFSITPQPLDLKQWIYIFIIILAFIGLIFFQLNRKSNFSIYLLFFLYPFFNQSAYYLNIAAPFFVLTPAYLYLLTFLFFSKESPLSLSFKLLIFFCLTTALSIFVAYNRDTALAFFVLGVGSFLLSAYIIYSRIRQTKNPLQFIRRVFLSILGGSIIYIIIETVVFRIKLSDVIEIVLRKFTQLYSGRYYTAGYWEPVGMGFVYSIVFWVILFYLQSKPQTKSTKWLNILFLSISFAFVWMSGSRAAFINIATTLFMFIAFSQVLKVKQQFRIRWYHVAGIGILMAFGVYYLIPRTIQTSRSAPVPAWITLPTVTIAGKTFTLVGTTAQYYRNSTASLDAFLHRPLGTGPLNARLDENLPVKEQFPYHYSTLSNLIVIGATFGWFSLGIWIILLVWIAKKVFKASKTSRDKPEFTLTVIFLAILTGSILPGSMFIGPNLNWSKFEWLLPLSAGTPGLPSDYPSIISGLVFGCLLGLLSVLSINSQKDKQISIE